MSYCDGLDHCILYCILFVFMLELLCFCIATEFSVNKDLYIISPILTHRVLWVAVLPSVPSTHHSHHPSSHYSHFRLKCPFSANPSHRSLLFLLNKWLHAWIPRTVYRHFWADPFLLFSFFPPLSFWYRAVDWAHLCQLLNARWNSISYRIVWPLQVCNLVQPTAVASLSQWASSCVELSWQHVTTINESWQNRASPQSGTKFQRYVPLFGRYLNFLTTQYGTGKKKPPCHQQARSV